MIIDFHTHAFADSIAERAISSLEKNALSRAHTRGTLDGLIEKMDICGVDKSVLLTIATKPAQQTVINNWAAQIRSERILPFGSVHPEAEDALSELERIKALGLYGVKLHPEYQNFFVGEERMMPIYRKCAELRLPVIFHAGMDAVSPKVVRCMPEEALKVHRSVPEMTMILAHFGGNCRWDEVEKHLVGEDIYFDIAYCGGRIPDKTAERIIRNHGSDRILFASDMPWQLPSEIMLMLSRLDISDPDRENICHKNAEKILGLG